MDNSKKMFLATQLSFGILGAIEAAWAPMVPFVKSGLQLDDGQFGQLLLAMGTGSLIAIPIVGPLISKFGPRLIAIVSGILLAASLVGISFSNSVILLPIMLAIFGACLIGIDVASNVNAVIVEDIFKRPLMSGFHGGYSVGTIVGALLMSMLLTLGLGINISSLAIFIIMSAMILVGCRALVKDVKEFNAKEIKDADNTEKKSKINLPPVIIVLGFLCFIMYGSEGALLSWGTVFATQNRGIDPQIAGYFYIFFAVTMSFTRLVGNKLVSRLGRRRTVVIGALLVALGFFITAMTPHYIGMMIGFAIIGLGAGNIVPQLVSFAGTVKGIQVQSAISLINAIGFSGILLSPVIIGHISNMTRLERSFEVLGVATFIVAVVSLKLLKKQKSN
mgnify:CR=1 FL=1